MKTLLKKFSPKRIILSLIMAFAIFSSSFSGYSFNLMQLAQVHASYKQEVSLITNNQFTNYTSSDKPATPANWTLLNPTGVTSIKTGIINAYPTTFESNKEDYELSQNPGINEPSIPSDSESPAYKHLMLNAYESPTRIGYRSSDFTLEKSSFYAINVVVKTTGDAVASIYVEGLSDEDVEASITNFSSFNQWYEYTIFISTSDFKSENVNLQLWLGGNQETENATGAVFFNRVNVIRYSASTFATEVYLANQSPITPARFVHVALNEPVNNNPVTNANFELNAIPNDTNIIPGFKTIAHTHSEAGDQITRIINVTENYSEEQTKPGIINPLSNNSVDNENVLFMYNGSSAYQGIESSDIEIKQHTFYKITVWVKAVGQGSGAKIVLVEKNVDDKEDFEPTKQTITIPASTSSEVTTNNWEPYSFYVEGHPLKDTVVNLQLWLGTEDSPEQGYVFFDNIQMQEVKYAHYSNASSLSNAKTFTFNENNNQYLVENGNFNLTQNKENQPIYPLTPRNWELNVQENDYEVTDGINGVINTNDTTFAKFLNDLQNSDNINHKNASISNPGLTPLLASIPGNTTANTSNNILIIGNTNHTTQTYTTTGATTLNGQSYYKVTFSLNTQITQTSQDSGVNVRLFTDDHSAFELINLNTHGVWKTYTVFIATKIDLTSKISLTLNNAQGYAFFDDVRIISSNEQAFNSAKSSNLENHFIVDFVNETFTNYTTNSTKALNTPFTWTSVENHETYNIKFGILNTNYLTSVEFPDITNPQPQHGNSVLMIGSGIDTYYTAVSPNYNLSSSNYYKISVIIKTEHLTQELANKKTNSDGEVIPFGAKIKLSQYEEHFTAIDTQAQSQTNQNEWVTYTFFVKPESDLNTNIEISLGYENALTSGYVYVDAILVETLERSAYTTEVENSKNSKTSLLLTTLEKEEPTPDTGSDFTGAKFDFLLVSSLLTGIAIVIAIIGTAIRRINFSISPKIKTTYDRRRTLEVELNKRERIQFRREIIDELKQEFDNIDNEIEEFLEEIKREEDEIIERVRQRKQHFEEIKQAINIEITQATKQFDADMKALEDQKARAERQKAYEKQVSKLQAKQAKADMEASKKEEKLEQLALRRERFLQKQEERKRLIAEEIARIEREIEEIAREEEQMWTEYRKAKEEAKRAKLEYLANKRAEERAKREAKKLEKQQSKQKVSSSSEENDVKVEESLEVLEKTQEPKNENEVEIITPDQVQENTTESTVEVNENTETDNNSETKSE